MILLDDEYNDIYIHVDKKNQYFPFEQMKSVVSKATLIFTKRIKINWGGYSQIKAELILLQEATQKRHMYYHLISGVDMPLKTQEEITKYLHLNYGKEFISASQDVQQDHNIKRIKYYWFLQECIGRNVGRKVVLYEKIEKISLQLQEKMNINRIRTAPITFYKGSNWFSITHELAVWILKQKKIARKYFKHTICADEIFIHTLAKASPFKERLADDDLRCVDWERGTPYTYTVVDFENLISTDKLFARKFDETQDKKIVDNLFAYIVSRMNRERVQ